jgi:hypothetical protein
MLQTSAGKGRNRGAMKRFQARRGNGRFTRNTPENTLGLHIDVCPTCRVLVPYELGAEPPDTCHSCGAVIVRERCAHGRCTGRFPDPAVFQSGGYRECGKTAVACSVDRRWGMCEEHLPE